MKYLFSSAIVAVALVGQTFGAGGIRGVNSNGVMTEFGEYDSFPPVPQGFLSESEDTPAAGGEGDGADRVELDGSRDGSKKKKKKRRGTTGSSSSRPEKGRDKKDGGSFTSRPSRPRQPRDSDSDEPDGGGSDYDVCGVRKLRCARVTCCPPSGSGDEGFWSCHGCDASMETS
mmetsp:Transcript_4418/g.9908  ORF Transcript_4418/g.9908 Transcript_4418/m.9908 type:complete len:173 (-) Transcript_4418:160-678(-)